MSTSCCASTFPTEKIWLRLGRENFASLIEYLRHRRRPAAELLHRQRARRSWPGRATFVIRVRCAILSDVSDCRKDRDENNRTRCYGRCACTRVDASQRGV
jgi:hypothetical protein